LPWGNEDYEFWTKLLTVGVKHRRLPGELVMYRYKKDSMMRDGAKYAEEERAMMRTMHLDLFHPAKIFEEHSKVMAMSNASRTKLANLASSGRLSAIDQGFVSFWLGLSEMHQGSFSAAMVRFSNALDTARLQWQPALYHALCRCTVHGPNASAAEIERLKGKYQGLRRTAAFVRHERNCLRSKSWVASIAQARDK